MAKLILDEQPPPGHAAVFVVYDTHSKKSVMEADADSLTKEEYRKYSQEVMASLRDELATWIGHKSFRRRPRCGARNVLDVRWAGKWKEVQDQRTATAVRRIKMRMVVRGFADRDAELLETSAGSCSRMSQRLVTSEAVCRGWKLAAIDVRKAFLKGVSYAELSRATD